MKAKYFKINDMKKINKFLGKRKTIIKIKRLEEKVIVYYSLKAARKIKKLRKQNIKFWNKYMDKKEECESLKKELGAYKKGSLTIAK